MTAPKEHEVTGCRDCAFRCACYDEDYCSLGSDFIEYQDGQSPTSCPLRKGPVLVVLKVVE